MARFALERHVGELLAHHAADLVHQFFLKLVLDLVELNVNCWHWLWAHDLLNRLFWDDKIKSGRHAVRSLGLELVDQHWLFRVSSWAHVSHAHSDWGTVSSYHLCWYNFHIFYLFIISLI